MISPLLKNYQLKTAKKSNSAMVVICLQSPMFQWYKSFSSTLEKILLILCLEDLAKLEVNFKCTLSDISNVVFCPAIFWEEDDYGFFTGSADGMVNYWRVDDAGP